MLTEYQRARSFALGWLELNKTPMKPTATKIQIARKLGCWDGLGGGRGALAAVMTWYDAALRGNRQPATYVPGDKFYNSQAWRKLRYKALQRTRGCCELCGSPPGMHPLHVDHIKPRSLYPALALELTNLQVLCRDCNLGKSNTDGTDWSGKRRRFVHDKVATEYGDEAVSALLRSF